MSALSDRLLVYLAALVEDGFPAPVSEYHFAAPARDWRFDVAYPDLRIAFEVEGGQFINGRHVRPGGSDKDAQKYNAAALLGWQVYRFPTKWIEDGRAFQWASFVLRLHLGVTAATARHEIAGLIAIPGRRSRPSQRQRSRKALARPS